MYVVVVAMLCKCWVCVELAYICAAILVLWQYVLYMGSRHGNTSLLHGMFTSHQSL